jgi:hypothetical protein
MPQQASAHNNYVTYIMFACVLASKVLAKKGFQHFCASANRWMREAALRPGLQVRSLSWPRGCGSGGGDADTALGEAGKFVYYVMQYVEGETLRTKLNSEHL